MSETPTPPTPSAPARWGLRGKTLVLLLAAALVYAALAAGVGHRVLEDVRRDLGTELARDAARLSQQRILAKVGQELALSRRMADSLTIADWLADETAADTRARAFREGESFRRAFESHSYFAASAASRTFYFADANTGPEPRAGYTIALENPDNAWFFTTLRAPEGYWINVDRDAALGVTNVWINVAARADTGAALGVVGTGIDLTQFLAEVLDDGVAGATTMILDRTGTIVAHPDRTKMAFNLAGGDAAEKTLFRMPRVAADAETLRGLAAEVAAAPERIVSGIFDIEGRQQIVALAHIPSLGWTVATLVDASAAQALNPTRIAQTAGVAALALLALLLIASFGFDRLVLHPLAGLTTTVRRIGRGDYAVRLESPRSDEIGDLTRAFDEMAQRVRAHAEHLESTVAARTGELALANAQMRETHAKLTDSIRYASLIQRAILPDRLLRKAFPGESFVLWRPRDVVGGDLYVYRANAAGSLFGVIDCAGHGVPGACMTMIAHAALEVALGDTPWDDPAVLLGRIDAVARSILPGDDRSGRIATNMDMGLAFVDLRRREVRFAGARVGLFWSDGGDCQTLPGSRTGINDHKPARYEAGVAPLLPGRTFYLTTDGLLDQAGGGRGFGFGTRRFGDWVAAHAALPLAEQKARLIETLDAYQGERSQRDDITVLAFRVETPQPGAPPVQEEP